MYYDHLKSIPTKLTVFDMFSLDLSTLLPVSYRRIFNTKI